jgi:hypothetical protein
MFYEIGLIDEATLAPRAARHWVCRIRRACRATQRRRFDLTRAQLARDYPRRNCEARGRRYTTLAPAT